MIVSCARRAHGRLVVWLCATVLSMIAAPVGGQDAPQPQAPVTAPDPLGRQSPVGTLRGFSAAAHRGDFVSAGRYLELRTRSASQTESGVEPKKTSP